MSYLQQLDNTSVYTVEDDYALVNSIPRYSTLGNYYNSSNCPYTTTPSMVMVKNIYINPSAGGKGFQAAFGNYDTLESAYPIFK